MSAVMKDNEQPLAVYNEFRAQLTKLREENKHAVFNYESPKGNKEARSHVYKLRQSKSAVERARKEEKQASLEYGRKVDAEAKDIISELDEMIEVHAAPLREIEEREKQRIANHEANLQEIRQAGEYTSGNWSDIPLEAMKDRLREIEDEDISPERWEEFSVEAAQEKDKAIRLMRDAIARREKHDAEQAELERLRKEKAEREKKEHEERIAREAEERARREAEERAQREREEAERKAKAEKEAAERRELELKLAAEKAQREREEAQRRADAAAKETEERLRRETEEARRKEQEENERRERDRKHKAAIHKAAIKALVAGGISESDAAKVVNMIANKSVPAVSISY